MYGVGHVKLQKIGQDLLKIQLLQKTGMNLFKLLI